jgi:predicted nucleic acid-binding protein
MPVAHSEYAMVIDTMVFAYALLGVPEFREESLAVLDVSPDILVPDSFRAELVNVVWLWVREKSLPLQVGIVVLRDADALVTQVVSSAALWERALALAVEANHSAYDTLFVALAESADTKLVTYDAKLQKSFPDRVLSPSELLA